MVKTLNGSDVSVPAHQVASQIGNAYGCGDVCQSYHGAEGMPQEDGVSVQKGLVSAALRRLQNTRTHTRTA